MQSTPRHAVVSRLGGSGPGDPATIVPLRVRTFAAIISSTLLGLGGTLAGCVASESAETTASPDVARAGENLSIDSILCTALDILPKAVPSMSSHCNRVNTDMLHYEGGFAPTGGLGDLFELPALTNTMLQCAVAHSDAQANEGVVDTPVGRFGVSAQFAVNGQGVTPTQYVEGERSGVIYIFGAPARLDVESVRFETAQEQRAAGTIQAAHVFTNEPYTQNVDARTGTYLHAESESANWGIGGKVTLPVGPIEVTITPNVTHDAIYEGLNNGLVAPASAVDSKFDFNSQLALELNCIARCSGQGLCVCQADPSQSQLSEHERLCNGGSCDYGNLSDGVLPYDGPLGGATQSSLYDVPMVNWFHFGPPGVGGGAVSGTLASSETFTEPTYDLGGSDNQKKANTTFGLDIDAGYSLGPASLTVGVKTDVKFRSAFAVRERHATALDKGDSAAIETSLDSQSAVNIGVDLKLDFGIFGPFTASFTIWNRATANAPKPLVTIAYAPQEHSSPESFIVNGQALDPSGTISQCLQQPVSGTPVTPPDDPASFLTQVGRNFVTGVHPCDAMLCDDNTSLTTCTWNASVGNLACTTAAASCNTCNLGQNYVAMCGADNQPLFDENNQPIVLYMSHGDACVR